MCTSSSGSSRFTHLPLSLSQKICNTQTTRNKSGLMMRRRSRGKRRKKRFHLQICWCRLAGEPRFYLVDITSLRFLHLHSKRTIKHQNYDEAEEVETDPKYSDRANLSVNLPPPSLSLPRLNVCEHGSCVYLLLWLPFGPLGLFLRWSFWDRRWRRRSHTDYRVTAVASPGVTRGFRGGTRATSRRLRDTRTV